MFVAVSAETYRNLAVFRPAFLYLFFRMQNPSFFLNSRCPTELKDKDID